MNWANDTITVQISFPSAFRETGRNEIIDSIALLAPVFEHLRQVRAGLSEDTVRIVHIGDSHVRGHIYPQTIGARLTETFGAVATSISTPLCHSSGTKHTTSLANSTGFFR